MLLGTGRGDAPADECRAVPRVFCKISRKRGRHLQRGNKKGFGLQSKTKEPQKEEEMCYLVRIKGPEIPYVIGV